jgi:hypothetical protein
MQSLLGREEPASVRGFVWREGNGVKRRSSVWSAQVSQVNGFHEVQTAMTELSPG